MAFSSHDAVITSPTNTFATLNPINTSGATISNGNLVYAISGTGTWYSTSFTIPIPKSGKYIIEFMVTGGSLNNVIGITSVKVASSWTSNPPALHAAGESYGFIAYDGSLSYNGTTSTPTGYGVSIDASKVYFMLIDCDTSNGSLYFGRDGTLFSSTAAYTNIFSTITDVMVGYISTANNTTQLLNFGADSSFGGNKTSGSANATDANGIGDFYYSPPTGALALCTANLPDPAIDPALDDLPEDYFKCVGYAGNGATGQTVTTGFQPDLIWMKNRDSAQDHAIVDSVRTREKVLFSNTTSSEQTSSAGKDIASIISTGFTVGEPERAGSTNNSGSNIIAWCWKAGGAPTADNTATSGAMTANSVSVDGTLQSGYTPSGSPTIYPKRMSVNTKAGFSIVKYQGAGTSTPSTIPHGLNHSLDFYIVKSLDSSRSWEIWFNGFTASEYMQLDSPTQKLSYSNAWGSVPTDSVFGVNNSNNANYLNENYIAYCWHSVEGYSKFGSYVGNGSADGGPFVACGFRPALILYKSADAAEYWHIHDNVRDPNNPISKDLYPHISSVEANYTDYPMDFLSNGFKLRSSNGAWNTSGHNYIYACWAEMPFKYATAR